MFLDTLNLPSTNIFFMITEHYGAIADSPPIETESTTEYVKHLDTIRGKNEKLYAHVC